MSRPVKISPSMAAYLFGTSERSIRRAIKSKELPVEVQRGRYHIDIHDLIIWSDKLPNRIKKRDEHGLGQYVKEWNV